MKNFIKSALPYLLILSLGLACGYLIAMTPKWLKSAYSEGDFKADYQASGTQVILFGTATCPYCAETRKLLSDKQVAYSDKDLNLDQQAQKRFAELGAKGVPVLWIGQRRIDGYNPAAILEALKLLPAKQSARTAAPVEGKELALSCLCSRLTCKHICDEHRANSQVLDCYQQGDAWVC